MNCWSDREKANLTKRSSLRAPTLQFMHSNGVAESRKKPKQFDSMTLGQLKKLYLESLAEITRLHETDFEDAMRSTGLNITVADLLKVKD